MIPFYDIDSSWTLFLDRDGVINHQKENGYINLPSEFEFYAGVKEAIEKFSRIFGRIIVITNQRGVGKGITSLENLERIHEHMKTEVENNGGKIHSIYFCPAINDDSPNRKPNTGMALQAQSDFPEINFSKSIMIGNSASDIHFGKNIGAYTVYLTTTNPMLNDDTKRVTDLVCTSLLSFANLLKP